jgi:putative colanic acid biosynthesis UDP-glucose lipid carrier transferase
LGFNVVFSNNTNIYPFAPFYVLTDAVVIFFAGVLAASLRPELEFSGMANVIALAMMPLAILMFAMCGVYQSWRVRGPTYFFNRLLLGVWLSFAMASIGMVLMNSVLMIDSVWFALWFVLINVGVFGYRYVFGKCVAWTRRHGLNTKDIVLIGTASQLRGIEQYFADQPRFGVRAVKSYAFEESEDLWMLSEEELAEVESYKPHDIWICSPLTKSEHVKNLSYQLKNSLANVRYIPHAGDMMLLNHRMTTVMGYNSIDLNNSPLCGVNHYVKLVADSVIATGILLMISPVMLMCALGVKLSSKGPIFFKQQRLGMNGRPITVYKFRSMRVHTEAVGTVTQAKKGDSRVTKFGAFLRSSSLDELPQFINVLQGRMSIVGPRPHAMAHNEYYKDLVDSYMLRHRVKPGITGWAQVNGFRGETDTLDKMEKRVQHDLWYIDNWSLWLDIRIIVGTAFKGFVNPNAY